MSKKEILARKRRKQELARRGDELNRQKYADMRAQMQRFEANLRAFATEHKDSIQRDARFRAHFHEMCAAAGVDPLTSRKGLWAELLGVGDYYYELAVRAIEACVATRPLNGGVIALDELVRHLRKRRSAYVEDVSSDDVERAVSKLDVLGGGYRVVSTGRGKLVTSVPLELSVDHTRILDLCAPSAHTTQAEVMGATGWSAARAAAAMDFLMQRGIAWVDLQAPAPTYWIMGLRDASERHS
eukprot:IDg6850t1